MSSADVADEFSEVRGIPRQWIVIGGRILLGLALLAAWEWGSRSFGPLFFAPPLATAQRIVEMAASGKLLTDVIATLRVSALGFVIGCACGIGLPFLLRRSERLTQAIEPFILASMGIPKYALTPWLILWFGIGDRPKVIVVTLFVFYIVFITVFAGMRSVDPRLISMARVVGASERAIARKVIWVSLLPFFFTGLKVALPRAVSAAIVGEFLVATEGIGFSIERARQLSDTTGVFAGIVIAVALVLLINGIVNVLERRALKWRPTDRDMQI
ncbi:ABC transporter permease [Rhodoplanes sp. Z2-YC6860]|uniref:ABC transporter permease n=1 Tax=Rhodoplanes sp. Z2-YC6860 TaxID=674703 RepID=UPI00078BE30E|nr:ABC transporter permease [Rhodoplanes sp. Z2-YC6860]AMN39368.1 ABC transporter permease [Rhodoplanes sp. Z2-YC6860]